MLPSIRIDLLPPLRWSARKGWKSIRATSSGSVGSDTSITEKAEFALAKVSNESPAT